jgi:D-tyrosyl-tRNA(Tyr) deacylase
MKVLLQRVTGASVSIEGEVVGRIGPGLTVLLGVIKGDSEAEVKYLADKTVNLRIFEDNEGRFNLSLLEVKGELLVVSQFTLAADTRKGKRPSFIDAAPPETAEPLIETFINQCRSYGIKVASGRFRAHMLVEIHNNGPVTIMLDSRDKIKD